MLLIIANKEKDIKDNLLSVYSIITGINLTDMDKIYSALDQLMGEPIDTLSLPKAVTVARNYLFELDPKLKDIASFIESLNKEQLDAFIDTIISASNGAYFDLKPIDDIELYQEKIMV